MMNQQCYAHLLPHEEKKEKKTVKSLNNANKKRKETTNSCVNLLN